jgi:hypothetical protein
MRVGTQMSPGWDRLSIECRSRKVHILPMNPRTFAAAPNCYDPLSRVQPSSVCGCTLSVGARLLSFAYCCLVLLTASSPTAAQLTLINPKHLEVPEEKAGILLRTACEVVAGEFQVSDASDLRFRLTLVLGEFEEHYTADEATRSYTLYLTDWNEFKFATLAMRLCVHQLPTRRRESRLVNEILRRSDEISPISARKLRNEPRRGLPGIGGPDDCMSALRPQPCQNSPQRPIWLQ